MCCSKEAHREEHQKDVDDEDSDIREDTCCNGERGVRWFGCPPDPECQCPNTSHAESEQGPRHDKSMAHLSIPLKDDLVGDGANYIEEEKDGADGYIGNDGGMAADYGNGIREIWWL